MAKTPKLTHAKLGDNPAPIVSVTRMCERCGLRPVQGGKKSHYCKPCSNEAMSAARHGRNMRPPTKPRCVCGNHAAPGSKFCATCEKLHADDARRLQAPSRVSRLTDAEQRRIDHAAYNSDIAARAEENPIIMARLMRGAVVPTLHVGHAEAGDPVPLDKIPHTPRAGDVALGW